MVKTWEVGQKITVKDINEYIKSLIDEVGDGEGYNYDYMVGLVDKNEKVVCNREDCNLIKYALWKTLSNNRIGWYTFSIRSNIFSTMKRCLAEIEEVTQENADDLIDLYKNYINIASKEYVLKFFFADENNINRDLFSAISEYRNKINIKDEKVAKEYDEKFYNLQKDYFKFYTDNYLNQKKYTLAKTYYGYRYSNLYEINSKHLKNLIFEADAKGDVGFFASLNKYQMQQLADKIDADKQMDKFQTKEIKQLFKTANATTKKLDFKKKVGDAVETIKDHTFAIVLCAVMLPGVLGASHHLWHMVGKEIEKGKDLVQIETNVENGTGFSKFTGNAILATQQDGKYFAEVFGIAVKEVGNKPEFCSVYFEVDKDTYDEIYKYYDIEYEYGKEGQLVGAKNKLRTNLEVCGLAKSTRADWDIMDKLAEKITKNSPKGIVWQNANADAIDIEPEM